MSVSGIYKIVNIKNGKLYVGSAVSFDERWYRHKWYLGKGEHHSSYLQRAWDKYKESSFNFEIIEECAPVKEVLIEREQHYIDVLKPEYNMCKIAGSQLGMKRSEEQNKRNSDAHKGKHLSEEQKQKMSEAHKGLFSGENHPYAKFNWDIVHEIRRRYREEKIAMKQLGAEYGVTKSCIQHIVCNHTWKEEQS